MSQCAHCKPLHGAETQVLRLKQDVREFIKLLTNAREDGGLTKVQCEVFDRLTARHEAVLAGQAGPDSWEEVRAVYQDILAECEVDTIQTLIEGWHCLREIAVEIGEITTLDMESFEAEDRTEIQPTFGLQCRIRALVSGQIECACCGHTGPRTAVLEVEHG
jgi:hypothetical protein